MQKIDTGKGKVGTPTIGYADKIAIRGRVHEMNGEEIERWGVVSHQKNISIICNDTRQKEGDKIQFLDKIFRVVMPLNVIQVYNRVICVLSEVDDNYGKK
jgi:hypothetical protein